FEAGHGGADARHALHQRRVGGPWLVVFGNRDIARDVSGGVRIVVRVLRGMRIGLRDSRRRGDGRRPAVVGAAGRGQCGGEGKGKGKMSGRHVAPPVWWGVPLWSQRGGGALTRVKRPRCSCERRGGGLHQVAEYAIICVATCCNY